MEKKLDEQLETEENKGSPDIDDLLKEEIKSIKSELNKKPEVRRFQAIESGANGIVFIKTTVRIRNQKFIHFQ